MMKSLLASCALALAMPLAAQSPLTTIFATNNGGANGWTMYFDVQVVVPIAINQIDLNVYAGAAGSIDVYTCPLTYVGNDTNAGAWTLGANGPITPAATTNIPSPCTLGTPLLLTPGSYGMALVHNGVAPAYSNGNGTTVPGSGSNQTYSTTELTVRCGASAGGGLGTAICCSPRICNMSIHYANGGGNFATKVNFGQGCNPPAAHATFYENNSSFDLSNTSLQLINIGNGYLVQPGTATWHTPTGGQVTLGDDVVQQFALGWTLPYPGGTTTDLWVSSNGFINATANSLSGCCSFNLQQFLTTGPCWSVFWRDLYPPGGGTVNFESSPATGEAWITFNQVPNCCGSTPVSSFQVHFTQAGIVEYVYGACAVTNAGTGWSPGANNMDPGSMDLSTLTTLITSPDSQPLALAGSARPQLGTSVNMTVSNIPPSALLSAVIYGFGKFNPGISLAVIGMPGCEQYCSQDAVALLFGGPTATHAFPVPNNPAFAGIHVIVQGASYDPAGGHNALGALSSNGVDLGLDIN